VDREVTSEVHSFANQFGFARDSPGTQLNLSQLNVLHQGTSSFSRYDIRDIAIHIYFCNALLIRPLYVLVSTIFEISRYVYRCNTLLIQLLKIPRYHKREIQLGFGDISNIVPTESRGGLVQLIQSRNITNERFGWVSHENQMGMQVFLFIVTPHSFERSCSCSGVIILVSPHQMRGALDSSFALLIELISSTYPMAVPGFEPQTSDMRGERVTTTHLSLLFKPLDIY
ncbi:hypothetical protein T265_15225, partial [Opisthorchis viverrini]